VRERKKGTHLGCEIPNHDIADWRAPPEVYRIAEVERSISGLITFFGSGPGSPITDSGISTRSNLGQERMHRS